MKNTPKIELNELDAKATAAMRERQPELKALDASIAAVKKGAAASRKERERKKGERRKRNAQLKEKKVGKNDRIQP